MGGITGRGGEHEHALLLLDAAGPKEIARRLDLQRAVAGGGQDVGRMEHGHGTGGQLLHEPATVGDEQGGIDRHVAHAQLLMAGRHCLVFGRGRKQPAATLDSGRIQDRF